MNSDDNLSLVLKKKGELILENREIPEVGPHDVLVGVESVGICGSDVHYWQSGHIGRFILKASMVLGHETSGRVINVGAGVKHLSPGDRVALEVGIPCRLCEICKSGSYNQCPDMKFCATPPIDGTLCKYFAHPADMCFKLPDHVTYEEGAMLEPLSVAVSACIKSGVTFGQTIFISGAGPIGLLMLLTCKAAGVNKVCISDIDAARLEFASKLGADFTYMVNTNLTAQENASNVMNTLRCNADVSIECSGAESALQTCIFVTKPCGIVQVVGFGNDFISVPISDIISRDIRLQGGFRYANCYPTALALVSSGKVDVKPLITHRFSLEQAVKAFETAHDPKSMTKKTRYIGGLLNVLRKIYWLWADLELARPAYEYTYLPNKKSLVAIRDARLLMPQSHGKLVLRKIQNSQRASLYEEMFYENPDIVVNGCGDQSYKALSVIYEEEGSSGVSMLKAPDSSATTAVKKKHKFFRLREGFKISFALHLMFVPLFAFLALVLLQQQCRELFENYICSIWFFHSLFCFAYSSIENNNRELDCWTRYGNLIRLIVMTISASLASAGFDLCHDQIIAFCGISCRIAHYGHFARENINRKRSSFSIRNTGQVVTFKRLLSWVFWTFTVSFLAFLLAIFFVLCYFLAETKFLHFAFCVILAFVGIMYIGIEHRLMKNGFCDDKSFTVSTARLFIDLFTFAVFSIRAYQEYGSIWD